MELRRRFGGVVDGHSNSCSTESERTSTDVRSRAFVAVSEYSASRLTEKLCSPAPPARPSCSTLAKAASTLLRLSASATSVEKATSASSSRRVNAATPPPTLLRLMAISTASGGPPPTICTGTPSTERVRKPVDASTACTRRACICVCAHARV